jgi:hypothetical protein
LRKLGEEAGMSANCYCKEQGFNIANINGRSYMFSVIVTLKREEPVFISYNVLRYIAVNRMQLCEV